jgi:hypothetical protein
MLLPPLTVVLSKNYTIKTLKSIDEVTCINITGCMFADLCTFEDILKAEDVGRNVFILRKKEVFDRLRESPEEYMDSSPANMEHLGLCILHVRKDCVVLVTDNDRELIVEHE